VIALLSVAGYGSLFFRHRPLHFTASAHGADANVHLVGMWIAFGATAALMAYFIGRVSSALAEREEELAQMRSRAEQQRRVTALLTLGAGAAHELASPLGTIAVAARELERHVVDGVPGDTRLADDARLIRSEIDRCRSILDRLSGRATADTGSQDAIDMKSVLDEMALGLTPEQRARFQASCAPGRAVHLPRAALAQAVGSLVRNAFDAAPAAGPVSVTASCGERLTIIVEDHGGGMSPEVLARAGEPFFTTKPAGSGLGLGLFLVRAFAEAVHGSLALESTEGRGTSATLSLPLAL
jgi:two-component system sensor histidine kinase RegB